jgi:hypothetical protein
MKMLKPGNMKHLLFASVTVLVVVGSVRADFAFGPPQNLGPTVNSSFADGAIDISADGLEMYFCSFTRPGGFGYEDLWVSTREDINDPWAPPVNLGPPVNSSYRESYPSVSSDGLTLYFSDYFYRPDRPGGVGGHDLWMATRTSRRDPWGEPTNLGAGVNSPADEEAPSISHDGLTLIFSSERAGTRGFDDLWMCTRPATQDPWSLPVNLGPVVNSDYYELNGQLSSDGLTLFFESDRPGGLGGYDIWVAVRKSIDDRWGPPINLGPPVNTVGEDGLGAVSADGKTLYFAGDRPGGWGSWDMWQAAILPVVDFNGDGNVAGKDLLVMAEHWGTDEQLCDIGPMPWGDGVVDLQDLTVLAEYIGIEVNDPTLVAHWALDEAQGTVASDSAGANDGTILGVPIWQPNTGKVGGALEFDGTYFIVADAALNPADGPFSILAWVKGGEPGQAIISQADGTNWLTTDPATGALMTDLKRGGRLGKALCSDAITTDGVWHRVAFTWDDSARRLYMDSILVAEDTQSKLADCYGGLNIGCGKDIAPGTFFTGLIDDVRIYTRVVRP